MILEHDRVVQRQRKKKTSPPPTWLHSEIYDNKDGHGRTLGERSLGCGPGPGQGPLMHLLYVGWQGTVHFSTQLFPFYHIYLTLPPIPVP